jgi:glutathione S-transferase
MVLKLHGVPLSQPFRSVAWACLQKRVPFEVQLVVPGMSNKSGSRGETYLRLNPLGTVPTLEDDGVVVVESAAMLSYLANKHQWADLYPPAPAARARVDSFMHWHHAGTRTIAGGFAVPYLRPDLAKALGEDGLEKAKKSAVNALQLLETLWLASGPFVAADHPTLADLLAYEEVAQVAPNFFNIVDLAAYPRVESWLARMAALPYHEEAHAALSALGDLTAEHEQPLMKRMGLASKAGLAAIAAAQPATSKL